MWDPSTIAVEKSELTLFQSLDGPDAQRCCLVVYSGPDLGRQIVLDEGLSRLGRSAVTQLQIGYRLQPDRKTYQVAGQC